MIPNQNRLNQYIDATSISMNVEILATLRPRKQYGKWAGHNLSVRRIFPNDVPSWVLGDQYIGFRGGMLITMGMPKYISNLMAISHDVNSAIWTSKLYCEQIGPESIRYYLGASVWKPDVIRWEPLDIYGKVISEHGAKGGLYYLIHFPDVTFDRLQTGKVCRTPLPSPVEHTKNDDHPLNVASPKDQ